MNDTSTGSDYTNDPTRKALFNELEGISGNNIPDSLMNRLETWVDKHPADTQAKQYLQKYSQTSGGSVSSIS